MLISWAESAQSDLIEILTYFVTIQEVDTGQRIIAQLEAATKRLCSFPLSGKTGQIDGTRELVLLKLPYIIIYEVEEAARIVKILHVFHTSRRLPVLS